MISTQPFSLHEHRKTKSGLAPTYGNVSSTNNPLSLNLMSLYFSSINSVKVFAASIFHISTIFQSRKIWLNKNQSWNFLVQGPHVNCITTTFFYFSHLVTTAWAFEPVIRHLRYPNQCWFSLWPIVNQWFQYFS